jgi:hypothetical protein
MLVGLPLMWRQQAALEHWYLYTNLHGIISQTTEMIVSAAVRTSDLAHVSTLFICTNFSSFVRKSGYVFWSGCASFIVV